MKGSCSYSHFNVGAAIRLSNGKIVQERIKKTRHSQRTMPNAPQCLQQTNYPDKDMESIAMPAGDGALDKAL